MRLLKFSAVLLIAGLLLLCGCSLGTGENTKLRDMEFTVLSEEVLPDELKGLITERKKDAFSFTYTDESYLYLCVGYGEQPTGGYSIAVNELYLTENAICVDTCLLGPSPMKRPPTPLHIPILSSRRNIWIKRWNFSNCLSLLCMVN